MNEIKYFTARVEGDATLYLCQIPESQFRYGATITLKTEYGVCLAIITSFLFDKLPAIRYGEAKFLNYASDADQELNREREKQAIGFRQAIRLQAAEMGLEMNITHLLYPLKSETLVIYYTAKDRVDFRQLLPWLRDNFKKRIIMRQISADERGEAIAHYSSLGHLQGASEIHRR